MNFNFKIYNKTKKTMRENIQILRSDDEVILQATGVVDKEGNEVYDGDYILYESDVVREFKKVTNGKTKMTFWRWDKAKKKWKASTHEGIEIYGKIIGNKYEGIKSKRLYNEMQENGINI